MKMSLMSLIALGLVTLVGCGSGKPSGPGAVPDNSNRVVGPTENTFTLETPTLSTKVQQGETKEATISVSRGKNFDQDVTLKFENVPAGVTITSANLMLNKGDKETKLVIAAADDAMPGDYTVKVVGHPATGADATNELKLTITKKS